jgi:outer membrane protein assembly factor BamD
MKITRLFIFALVLVGMVSCGEYYEIKESNDYELKYKKALEYYDKGEYAKSEYLLNEVIPTYRGTSKYENISYYYVMSLYKQEFYNVAAHYFNLFTTTFPQSERLEECHYKSALCYYYVSPEVKLDQQNTHNAINGFLKYIKLYPDSDKISEINKYLDICRDKLTNKSYINARLYYDREKFKSAIVALNNSLNDYPESSYREEVKYLLLQSHYQFAKNSIVDKQADRYKEALQSTESFIEEFPESQYIDEANTIKDDIKKNIK